MITAQDLALRFHAFRYFRFSEPDMWMTGNCFQFSCIVSGWLSSNGISTECFHTFYDVIDGHFLVWVTLDGENFLLDWKGIVDVPVLSDQSSVEYRGTSHYLVKWPEYRVVDDLHYERILRDCCL